MNVMKIKSIKLLIVMTLFPLALLAQSMDCPSTLKSRKATPPYAYNDLSKSAQCVTGKKYEFMLPLMKGKDYRLTFYASPIFNNKINFKVIDMSNNKVVLDLPGENDNPLKGTCVLREYYDTDLKKPVYPFFDFAIDNSTSLKVIIDVLPASDSESTGAPAEVKKGCITVFIQDKVSEDVGF
jgi:hypothetical protein